MSTINFYRVGEPFGCFSNFAAYPVTMEGVMWPTSEHRFQAQKIHDETHREAIRTTQSPMDAAKMGRDRTKRLREDWENIKDDVMYRVVLAKFSQHPGIRSELLSTGDASLVEHTKNDSYWGDGGDGSGRNMLGQILMRVREEIARSLRG